MNEPMIRVLRFFHDYATMIFLIITTCLRCEIISGQLHADGIETLEVLFADVNDLPKPLLPMHPQWLADALSGQPQAFIH